MKWKRSSPVRAAFEELFSWPRSKFEWISLQRFVRHEKRLPPPGLSSAHAKRDQPVLLSLSSTACSLSFFVPQTDTGFFHFSFQISTGMKQVLDGSRSVYCIFDRHANLKKVGILVIASILAISCILNQSNRRLKRCDKIACGLTLYHPLCVGRERWREMFPPV